MSYGDSWGSQAKIFASQEFVSSKTMIELVRHLAGVKIAVEAARNQALDFIKGIKYATPVGKKMRFDEEGVFVAMDSGDWPAKIAQVLAALNFKGLNQTREGKERVEVGTRVQMKRPTSSNSEATLDEQQNETGESSAIPNDVIISFETAVKNMRLQLAMGEQVWTREKFEEEYGVRWA